MALVEIRGITKEYPEGTTWMEVAREYQKECECGILLVRVNGKLQELHKQVKDCELSFATAENKLGMSAYQRSASLIVLKVFCSVAGADSAEKLMIDFSTGRGFSVRAHDNFILNQEFLNAVKTKMREYVERKIPIMKRSVSTDDAIELFEKLRMYDKARLFRYRMMSRVNIYSIDDFEGYYHGHVAQDTGYIKRFDLIPYHHWFVVVVPNRKTPDVLHRFTPSDKLFATLSESTEWSRRTDLKAVGALNDKIVKGDMPRLILIQEALQEKRIAKIAAQITVRKSTRFIVIAGPSSSGRTAFSYRLSVQLEAIGLKPHPTAVDNYFVNRVDNPRDEHGNYNYEILECLDVKLPNRDMTGLLEGKQAELPYYNFKKEVGEYKGNFFQLGEGDILVIEGIRCLNDGLSYTPPADSKLKIYTNTLTQLGTNKHSRIPTTDRRFLRRVVRDTRTRGSSARETIRMWPSVRRDEKENIFPFQEGADVMFNSALAYELVVLKQYAQPLLFATPEDDEKWLETKRLLKFLDYFIGVSSEGIPENSILREFTGGSCLNV